MRLIDVDQSGTLDFDEFIALVFDDHETLLEVLRSKLQAKVLEGRVHPTLASRARRRRQQKATISRLPAAVGGAEKGGAAGAQCITVEEAHAVNKRLLTVFESMDTGFDAALPLPAFGAALENLDIRLSPSLQQSMLGLFDVDGSSTIDFKEFQAALMTPEALAMVQKDDCLSAPNPRGQPPQYAVTTTTAATAGPSGGGDSECVVTVLDGSRPSTTEL